jgi:ribosome-associated protein
MSHVDVGVRTGLVIPDRELLWRFSRSGGPGGQGVNTADSRATLTFDVESSPTLAAHPTWHRRALEGLGPQIVINASKHRAQLANREAALARLGLLLRQATDPPPRPRRPTKPTRGSQERRIASKKKDAETKRLRGKPSE